MADLLGRLEAALASRYRIERELGRGGMATVYLAKDLKHNRLVALKVLDPDLAAAIGPERFLREIELAAGLSHPHILPLFDSGTAADLLFYVMPYAEGDSLRDRLNREKQLPLEDAICIARDVADALRFAHGRGWIHRDIKPENILLQSGHALVADLGIARAIAVAGDLTAPGVVVGTPAYMSTEQAAGSRELDGRSDLYSLGCVVYEMLAGQPPFTGPTAEAVIFQHLSAEPHPVTALRPSLSKALAAVLSRALAKTPADRYQTAADFSEALQAATVKTEAVEPVSPDDGTRRFVRRTRRAWVAITVLLVLGAIGGALALRGWWQRRATAAGPTAEGKKAWVMVAEFDGPREDPSLASAVRQLVVAGLDDSKTVQSVSGDQLRIALQLAGKPDSTPVDASLAHELAFRSGIKVVVEGRIDRLGTGYSVIVRARDTDDGHVIYAVDDQMKDQNALVTGLARLVSRLRGGLGEKGNELTPASLRWTAAVPSFEVYRQYAEAFELQQMQGDDRGSLRILRDVLRKDPDFAEAWALQCFAFSHLGQQDSSLAALSEALRHPLRLTEEGRMFLQAINDGADGSLESAVATYRELIRRGYQLSSSWGNLAGLLINAGRYSEALECLRNSAQASPFGPQQWVLGGEVVMLLMFDQLEEARRAARGMKGWYAEYYGLTIEVRAGKWRVADSLATRFERDPSRSEEVRSYSRQVSMVRRLARGRFREVRRALHERPMDEVLLALASATSPTPGVSTPAAVDTSIGGLISRGLSAAAQGNLTDAEKVAAAIRARPAAERSGRLMGPAILEAWIKGLHGHWDQAADQLRTFSRGGEQPGYDVSPIVARWLIVRAFGHLAQPDSIATYLELALSHERLWAERDLQIALAAPFAHGQLAALDARRGRLAEAEQHLNALERSLTEPDEEARRLLEEARSAVARARRT